MKKMMVTILLLSFSSSVWAAVLNLQPAASKVEFEAIGRPSMMKVKGQGPGPAGQITVKDNSVRGVLELKLTELKTGI